MALIFIKIGLKLIYFCPKKYKIFERWELRPQIPVTALITDFLLRAWLRPGFIATISLRNVFNIAANT